MHRQGDGNRRSRNEKILDELWDSVRRNLIAVYDSEDETFLSVRRFVETMA